LDKIRKYIKSITEINDEDWSFFSSKLRKKSYPKKSIITEIGEVENHISFIEKGIVKLNQVRANVSIKLYEGSIYGALKNSNMNVTSTTGKIKVDDLFYEKIYQKKSQKNKNNFSAITIKANIFLTTK
jgi:signal-transduction protein with cAMP-binding, CBS, and nucleotidyltransferase domain